MATVKQKITENDVVELLDPVGKWPTGTEGTVISERGEWKLIEISEDQPPGQMLDMISVAESRLKLIATYSI
jgi:hypothetical protein